MVDGHMALSRSASAAESFANIFAPLREYQVLDTIDCKTRPDCARTGFIFNIS